MCTHTHTGFKNNTFALIPFTSTIPTGFIFAFSQPYGYVPPLRS